MSNQIKIFDGRHLAHIARSIHMWKGGKEAEELKSPNGEFTTLLKGTLNIIGSVNKQFGEGNVIVAYDGKTPSWRYDIYPQYKGGIRPINRESAFSLQLDRIQDHLSAFGILTAQTETLEGDDIMALLAERKDLASKRMVLISDDRDLLAYVSPNTYYYSQKVKKLVAPATFEPYAQQTFKYTKAVGIDGWPLFRALAGDSSDNIKGVSQCGPVSASEIISELKSLGAELKGYRQDYADIEPQIEALKPKLSPKLQAVLTNNALNELKESYNLVRVANAPSEERAQIANMPIVFPTVSADSIHTKLKDLGFKQWEDDKKWIQRFVTPEVMELGI